MLLAFLVVLLLQEIMGGRVDANIDKTNIILKWDTNYNDQSVVFSVILSNQHLEFVIIGFSDHGYYNNSDVCIFYDEKLRDGYINKDYTMDIDRSQDCELLHITKNGYQFRRRFTTCDPKDYAFESATTQLIIAGGYDFSRNFSREDIKKELHYGHILEVDHPIPTSEKPTIQFNVLAEEANVPSEVTNYWCIIKMLPQSIVSQKHHIIKMAAIIQDGNQHLVHHMEVFQCQSDDQEEFSGNCNDRNKPIQSKSCSHVIAAWAMGEGPIFYPREAGLPIGGLGAHKYIMVEIHYNNIHKLTGVIDSSGFEFTATPNLRKYDAGIMELGLIYSDANSIPPGQDAFPMTGYCVADCTNKLPDSGIYIFASQLHAHLTGRKLWTSHYRNGVKIGEINRDNHYSPHWQHITQLRPYAHIKQGDVLTTTCVYESRGRSEITLGGYGIEDEMCVDYIYYFPASDIEVCKSAIDNGTLHNYFKHRYNIKYNLPIHKKYQLVEWNDNNVHSLRELYSVSPLNVACLQHDGSPFQNHVLNWTSVSLPHVYSGPYNKERQSYECAALND